MVCLGAVCCLSVCLSVCLVVLIARCVVLCMHAYITTRALSSFSLSFLPILHHYSTNTTQAKAKDLPPVDHSKIDYEPFRKSFYIQSGEIGDMSEAEVKAYREKELEGVRLRGKDVPRPIKKFVHCGLPNKIYSVIQKLKYTSPFPIQCQAIPVIMSGRDCIACAKTGSGKTLAFVLPLIRHVMDQPKLASLEGPIALIMAPTRELAIQVRVPPVRVLFFLCLSHTTRLRVRYNVARCSLVSPCSVSYAHCLFFAASVTITHHS
jgi:hypothetical protein